MTTADKLQSLVDTKYAIRAAINAKGVSVSGSVPFDGYADKIRLIESGGGNEAVVIPIDNLNIAYTPPYILTVYEHIYIENADAFNNVSDTLLITHEP